MPVADEGRAELRVNIVSTTVPIALKECEFKVDKLRKHGLQSQILIFRCKMLVEPMSISERQVQGGQTIVERDEIFQSQFYLVLLIIQPMGAVIDIVIKFYSSFD
jgi:hypothetical protein